MPDRSSGIRPMTKQLKSVTERPVPAPARIRPAGSKRWSLSASANVEDHSLRFSCASASAAARATRVQLSSTVRSMGVPSGALSRYFMSQIWWASVVITPNLGPWRDGVKTCSLFVLKPLGSAEDFRNPRHRRGGVGIPDPPRPVQVNEPGGGNGDHVARLQRRLGDNRGNS